MNNFFKEYFDLINEKVKSLESKDLVLCANTIIETSNTAGKVIIFGNGGSAAIASHASIDFTKAAGIRAINFNESSLITCFSNDYGYERWVEKALAFYADKNDLAIFISSSGESKNMINGSKEARKMGLPVITLSGFSKENSLRRSGDINLWVNSDSYNVIETVHQIWVLSIVDYIISKKNCI